MRATSIESKCNAAYQHGRMDFRAGAPCDPKTPLTVYSNLSEEDKKLIAESWLNGWHNESLMQSLPEGLPA
jgi:hypothetical protein